MREENILSNKELENVVGGFSYDFAGCRVILLNDDGTEYDRGTLCVSYDGGISLVDTDNHGTVAWGTQNLKFI